MSEFPKKPLSIFGLVAINVIAIDSLRTLPLSAEYGLSVVFYYLLAAITFFIPIALISAELATGWPETGGIYVWIREAFGKRIAFVAIWLQWFYNICWYPTIMSLIAVTIAYVINPQLVNNKLYMLGTIMGVFWIATLLNCFGMRVSGWVSNIAAIIGTLVPIFFIIVLACVWVIQGHPMHMDVSLDALLPSFSNSAHWVLFISILYGLIGIEMSASHASDVRNPQRDYPKAILYSTIIILFTLVFGSLAISVVVPLDQINIVSGMLQAFSVFFTQFHMQWIMPLLAVLIVCGAFGGAAAWMLGPTKGMLMAAKDGALPASLSHVTRANAPVRLLLLQGVIFTILCSAFVLMPSFNAGFWLLTDVTAILALLVYVVLFPTVIVLRHKFPEQPRAFTIPGGKVALWVLVLLGLATIVFSIVLGFIPPEQIVIGNVAHYEMILIGGVLVSVLVPFLVCRKRANK